MFVWAYYNSLNKNTVNKLGKSNYIKKEVYMYVYDAVVWNAIYSKSIFNKQIH